MTGKRVLSIILMMSMALSLTACGESRNKSEVSTLTVPDWIEERKQIDIVRNVSESSDVNFYYDNTVGMLPFVCNAKGETAADGKAAVSGVLVNWISSVREILQKYNGQAYTLQPDENDELHWAEYNQDIRNNFSNSSFYTKKGHLPMDGDAQVGPLSQLYYEHVIDSKAINIVLTDLAEQSVNITELASRINSEILSQEGYAAAIIAVNCPFNGKAYVPNPDMVSQLLKGNVQGKRPLYMILTGPEDRLSVVYQNLIEAMKTQGMKEDNDYFTYMQPVDKIVSRVSDEKIVVPPTLAEGQSKSFKKYAENSIFYDNFALEHLDNSQTAELFGSDTYLDYNINAFEYQNTKNTDRLVLNYYIPLEEYSGNYRWSLARSKDDELKQANSVDALTLIEGKDYLTYDYVISEEVEVNDDEGGDGSAVEDSREAKRERKKRSSSHTETVYSWYNSGDKQTSLKDFEDAFEITACELLGSEEIDAGIESGALLIDDKGNVVEASDSDSGSRRRGSTYQLEASDAFSLSDSEYWLHLCIEGKPGSFQSNVVAFDLPVYAYIDSAIDLPDWVEKMNAKASSSKDNSFFTHTFNLTGFYSTLFGASDLSDPTLYQYQREVEIADIVTVITGLPTKGASR